MTCTKRFIEKIVSELDLCEYFREKIKILIYLRLFSEKPHPLLSSFSVYTNGQQLFRISEAGSQLTCLHGLRFFSMCWVVLCHAYGFSISGATVNLADMGKVSFPIL